MTHPQGPFKSLLGPKPLTALPAPASFQAPAIQEASISIPQTSTTRSSSEAETRQGDAAIRKVHFILNSKGGVGKSFVAFLLALYYRHLREPILCFDADATTATFSRVAERFKDAGADLIGKVRTSIGLDQGKKESGSQHFGSTILSFVAVTAAFAAGFLAASLCYLAI